MYWATGVYAASAALFHLYTAGYGTLEPRLQRSVHLLFLAPLVFVVFPFNGRSPRTRPTQVLPRAKGPPACWTCVSWTRGPKCTARRPVDT